MNKLNYFKTRPKATQIDVKSYLRRLELEKEEPSIRYLKKLHFAHVHKIPFENLDIHYNQKIQLDFGKIFRKIVERKRGGFCYELNGLFYHLLYHLGFDCFIASAQVMNDEEIFGPDYDHMITIVKIDDKLILADVGFGDAFSSPKEIDLKKIQMDYTTYWKFEQDPDENYLLRSSDDASYYRTKYRFNLEEKQIIQFLGMCDYHQSSDKSPFTQNKMITIKTKDGRITLTDRKLKILELGEITELDILNEDEFLSKLEQHFSISFHQLIPRR